MLQAASPALNESISRPFDLEPAREAFLRHYIDDLGTPIAIAYGLSATHADALLNAVRSKHEALSGAYCVQGSSAPELRAMGLVGPRGGLLTDLGVAVHHALKEMER
ncbi:hypothetical protein GRI39_02065 [Altererythrobacter indicus]|uniref:Uncharacterized protein n=2 Tax=Altericroceibacterium indicum TaxID=374177 RepID=A0A845A3K4_9SPHN|nr:hypothetical protein [Altericroceibacterium indicum]